MQAKTDIQLTSAEIGTLWTTYMNDSMAVCALKYFLEKEKDTDIRPVIEYALGVSQKHIRDITGFFNKEDYPIPHGFTDDDLDVSSATLYMDVFYLVYLRYMWTFGLNTYGIALPIMARQDIIDFFLQCLNESIELNRRVTAIEIAHIYSNIRNNFGGKALLTGFAQVAESSKVKELMMRGINIAVKDIEVLSSSLKKDDIPVPMIGDSFVKALAKV